MRAFVLILGFLGLAAAASAVDLFRGGTLSDWQLTTNPAAELSAVCQLSADGVLTVAGKPVGYLATIASYQNYRLQLEYRWTTKGDRPPNGGILLHIASDPVAPSNWPICFQVQTKSGRAGDLLPMGGATFAEALSTPPEAKTPQLDRLGLDSEKPFGQWNVVEVICRGDTITCSINGVRQNSVTGCAPHAGKVGFQLEGFPFELRNVRLVPLDRAGR